MTFLEFLSLMVLYMAWSTLLVRMILADDDAPYDREDAHG